MTHWISEAPALAVETPCIVIDNATVDRNIAAMASAVARTGARLRPHAKTHKLPPMAQRQLQAGACGITVAKIAEAEVMASGGARDIFVAYPLIQPTKLERALRLIRDGVRLIVGVDSLEGARRASQAAIAAGLGIEMRLEIDTGLSRTGILPDAAVELGLAIAELPALTLGGIFTYRGAMLDGAPTLDVRAAGREEGKLMADCAERMRAAGLPIVEVSVGSSPTALHAAEVPGVTEVRPGTYIYQDRMQAAFGLCAIDDCAAAVLATVVSRPAPDRIVIDGGSKAFATDVQPGKAPLYLEGFGHIVGDSEARFERMNEEHGVIAVNSASGYGVGDLVAIIPNHICSTVNLHNAVYLRDPAGALTRMPVAARGLLD